MKKYLVPIFFLLFPEIILCESITLNIDETQTSQAKTIEKETEFDIITKRIINDIKSKIITDDKNVERYINQLNTDGSFPDVNYRSTDRTLWDPLKHLDRMLEMGLAYVSPESKYYKDNALKEKLDMMLSLWHLQRPHSNNWYQNEIAEPQRMGMYLLLIQNCGDKQVPEDLFNKSIERLKNKGGNPSQQAGANRVDVALHWLYRACMTKDYDLLKSSTDYIYSTVAYTMGAEGLQIDNSYTQHGRQLHIGQYGDAFLNGVTKASSYTVGTSVALSGKKLEILSSFVRDTYLGAIRGKDMAYNVIGRASTRPDAVKKNESAVLMERMILLDPTHAKEYEQAIKRLTEKKNAGYHIKPRSRYYYRTNYSLHIRPEYTMDLRFVSKHTVKNEQGIGNREAYKQYFLSDGSTGIFVNGDEYENIFPVWNYTKIPGVTCPEVKNIPVDKSYITYGQTDIAGGVTDSMYNVSAYKYVDNRYGIETSANKAWFFFDKEILCIGNNIRSNSQNCINTTVNQCVLDGDIEISAEGKQLSIKEGIYEFTDKPEWILHDNVGYFFLQDCKVELEAVNKSGNWKNINGNYNRMENKGVFTLSINHGIKPSDGKYIYLIVPNMRTVKEARKYNSDKIDIIENSDSIQAIYHKELNIYGIVFYKPGTFSNNNINLSTDAPCAIIVKNINKPEVKLHVANIGMSAKEINLKLKTGFIKEKHFRYKVDNGQEGKTLCFCTK